MPCIITTRKAPKTAKQATYVLGQDTRNPFYGLRSANKFFWYTDSDGIERKVSSSAKPGGAPRQVNDYIFDPTSFAHFDYPRTFPAKMPWPPRKLQDLLVPLGEYGNECVGEQCYSNTNALCEDMQCMHTFKNWKLSTEDWQTNFELRKTADRGIGVYTKRSFKKGDILGWYAGELIDFANADWENNYLMDLNIGAVYDESPEPEPANTQLPTPPSEATTDQYAMVDGATKGNWTRFINHSCMPHCEFRLRRVGNVRIMTVEALKSVRANVELTVHYGDEYYSETSPRICHCNTRKCIEKRRREEPEEKEPSRAKRRCRVDPSECY